MTVIAVDDLIVESQIQHVAEIAHARDWPFERVNQRCFRISLSAQDGEIFQLEVCCDEFPVLPPAFHWRNPGTGERDQPSDAPSPNGDYLLRLQPDMRTMEPSCFDAGRAAHRLGAVRLAGA